MEVIDATGSPWPVIVP
jgi:hypothetical protein